MPSAIDHVIVAVADGFDPSGGEPATYRVDVPGGHLAVTWTPDYRGLLTGPAVLVAARRVAKSFPGGR